MTVLRQRSFVRRGGRGTPGQMRAQNLLGPVMCLPVAQGVLNTLRDFGRIAPVCLEIGFGSGQSLLQLAKRHPEINFVGVETYKPGIGALLMAVAAAALTNVRVYEADAVDVLEKCLAVESLHSAQLFFPDPWQKRRHHARRLIQPAFVRRLTEKLQHGAVLHVATDWEDYALHMLQVLSAETALCNIAGVGQFAARSLHRPVLTKFERRAQREGRVIFELQFERV